MPLVSLFFLHVMVTPSEELRNGAKDAVLPADRSAAESRYIRLNPSNPHSRNNPVNALSLSVFSFCVGPRQP
jgi:hypothetical protein